MPADDRHRPNPPGGSPIELIEDDSAIVSTSEVRAGPGAPSAGRLAAAGLLVAAGLAAWALFSAGPEATGSQATTTTTPTVSSAPDAGEARVAAGELPARAEEEGPLSLFGAPRPLVLPDELPVAPPGRKQLTLIGQNSVGQVAAWTLSTGRVTEIDPIEGQRFIPRALSHQRVAGFRVFLGETVTLGADGSIRSMPVTEMDLPLVFAAAAGDGFIVLESTSNDLWWVGDDGTQEALSPLPDGLVVEAAVDSGLVVRTLDDVFRRYDLDTGVVGDRLVGAPVSIGRDRYLTLSCDGGDCATTVRALGLPRAPDSSEAVAPDSTLVDLTSLDDLLSSPQISFSPSGHRLAYVTSSTIEVLDAETAELIASLSDTAGGVFVWAPDDTLFYWATPRAVTSGESRSQQIWLFDRDGQRSVVSVPTLTIDLALGLFPVNQQP